MRFIPDADNIHLYAIINAVRTNPESWKDWRCVKFEMLTSGSLQHWQGISASIKRILEIYLQDKQGSVYMGSSGSIVVFCKDVSEALIETMGRQIIDLVKSEARAATIFRVFELFEDTEGFFISFKKNKSTNTTPQISMGTDLPFYLPDTSNTRSDNLSHINGPKVLLVEDDPVTRWMVKMALKNECRLVVAANAHKAIAAYQNISPDLVLLDINLPDSNGQEVMSRIITSDPAAHIIMFSSQDSLETMVETMTAGAKGFIAKPFNKERLIQCVQDCRTTQ